MNKQFEEWLIKSNYVEFKSLDDYELWMFYAGDNVCATTWNELAWVFKWGVYLEFFDSVGINLDDITMQYFIDYPRQEAQQEAIKKAFSLI